MDIDMKDGGISIFFSYRAYTDMRSLLRLLQEYEKKAVRNHDKKQLESIQDAEGVALAALGDVHLKGKAK